ncbi:uncharacterized protein UV8b_06168 [Ustilaginoidea virens]|uniref:Uncharacterized protein n=1 Tax=Ustilaginoidea virens TaxID=1159556 RepID=A0A8E5HUV0_USTVR|nr:uncharacterized protein UV8b_06168 [Ustilaginoidea virens]QUC21927.1 hypothetical protein UV8b_06168 [Ustilaginoidea virens]
MTRNLDPRQMRSASATLARKEREQPDGQRSECATGPSFWKVDFERLFERLFERRAGDPHRGRRMNKGKLVDGCVAN